MTGRIVWGEGYASGCGCGREKCMIFYGDWVKYFCVTWQNTTAILYTPLLTRHPLLEPIQREARFRQEPERGCSTKAGLSRRPLLTFNWPDDDNSASSFSIIITSTNSTIQSPFCYTHPLFTFRASIPLRNLSHLFLTYQMHLLRLAFIRSLLSGSEASFGLDSPE